MTTTRTYRRIAIGFAALVLFAFAGPASARAPISPLSEPGYERLRGMAQQLEQLALHANDEARHRGVWFYGHDRDFRRSVSNFARRATGFRARMENYRTSPWQVDDELRGLLRDASAVSDRLQHSRSADDHTVADWDDTVRLLNRMVQVYQDDVSGRSSRWNRRDLEAAPSDRYRDERDRSSRVEPGYRSNQQQAATGPYNYGPQDLPSLARELEQRAARVADAARQIASPSPFDPSMSQSTQAIQRFAERAAGFRERVDAGIAAERLRSYVARLVEESRVAGNQVRAENLSPQTRNDWNAVLQLVDRIRTVSGL